MTDSTSLLPSCRQSILCVLVIHFHTPLQYGGSYGIPFPPTQLGKLSAPPVHPGCRDLNITDRVSKKTPYPLRVRCLQEAIKASNILAISREACALVGAK